MDLSKYPSYRSCVILAVEFVFILIVLRRFSSLWLTDRVGSVLFALLGVAGARIMSVGDGASVNKIKQNGVVLVKRCSREL